jgi:hypothetical protein
MVRGSWAALLAAQFAALGAATACGTSSPRLPREVLRTERDRFGLLTCSGKTPDRDCFTNRALMGASMGAGGAGQLGFARPELFDAVAMLGIPIVDWVFMLRNMRRGYLGGFCDLETILAHADELADPHGAAFCGPEKSVEKLEPSGRILEPAQDFNHLFQGAAEGRGGSFGRSTLRRSFHDISKAFGNATVYNPAGPYLPPGVPPEYLARTSADRCAHPIVLKGFKNKEYNPDGTNDVITVCDTRTEEGNFDPAHPAEAAYEVLLAVDLNKNGVRDYAEPIVTMFSERFEDVGLDPNDVYDYAKNPAGKAQNWIYDEGEPFDDDGLDGVPGTGDFGEGNGRFDYHPNAANYFAQNPRFLIEKMPVDQLDRLSIWADAGIRDFLVSAGGMNWFWGSLAHRAGARAHDYTGFGELPPREADYDFLAVDYSKEAIGQYAYLRYGDPAASQAAIDQGDGNHVGPPDQILNRLLTAMHFVQSRFHVRDVRVCDKVVDIDARLRTEMYHSNALDEDRAYGIMFPPGYEDPENTTERYPVVYYLHGQGMEFHELLTSGLLYYGYMADSSKLETKRRHESDWAKAIIVFPDSLCRNHECELGNFNANFIGIDGHGPRYEDALFELMAHIESTYRVAPPVEVLR